MLNTCRKWNRFLSILMVVAFIGSSASVYAGGAPAVPSSSAAGAVTTAGGKAASSLTGLAITATSAIGARLAIQYINGQRFSIKNAAQAVTTPNFIGTVAGSAVGVAGGQLTSMLIKSFIPGPIGAVAGALLPVLGANIGSQMGGSVVGGVTGGQFNLVNTWKSINKVDLVGSTIGSTIGMMIGAPIPVIGPIIGGIVGGFLGSTVAKWVTTGFRGTLNLSNISGFWRRGTSVNPFIPQSGVSTTGGGQSLGMNNGGQFNSGLIPGNDRTSAVSNEIPVTGGATEIPVSGNVTKADAPSAPISGDLGTMEKKYYDMYLNYNRLLEQGKNDEAQKLSGELKVVADQYNALKAQKGSAK
ncbi:MAG: hypothetical protein HQM09_03605 [Candidatus Riflebacteria bacterium]|nr:hypothetical protein [Candidatus Riflebacteria bacterium]